MDQSELIKKDVISDIFELDTAKIEDSPENEAFDFLANHIEHLMQSNKDFLLSLMYRLDISESKINAVLHPLAPLPPHEGIAHLIINRQKERILTKKKYKRAQNLDPDVEVW